MSFVITTVSKQTVVQVSDTRLSSLLGRLPLSEDLRKSVFVNGAESQFVLGWCGLATTHGHSTADWVLNTLHGINALRLVPEQIVESLTTAATERFRSLMVQDKRCHFTLAGWDQSGPFIGIVSNYAVLSSAEGNDSGVKHSIPTLSEAAVAAARFQGWTQRFRNPTEDHFVVQVMGDCNHAKLKVLFRGLEGLLKKRAGAARISLASRQIALEAGRHSTTIGKDLIALEMSRNGQTYCTFYSESGAEVMLVPDMLSLQGISTQVTVRSTWSEDQVIVTLKGKIAKS